jgi:hypothetical protein
LQLDVVYVDEDLFELEVSACNGGFAGHAHVFAERNEPEKIAAALEGFPRHIRDERALEIGTFGPKFAGGEVHMKLYCADAAGHAVVELRLASDSTSAQRTQSVVIFLPVEAAALDDFIEELRRIQSGEADSAALRTRA